MVLNPDVQKIIARCNEWDATHPFGETPDYARFRIHSQRVEIWRPEFLPVGYFFDRLIQGPGGDLRIRTYRPLGMTDSSTHPTVIYLHGGGWSIGGIESHESQARRICNRLGAVVVAVDYRLAPEHPFPAGYEDSLAAYHWVVEHIDELGRDIERIGIGGDSAGGNLSAAVAIAARDEGQPLAAQLHLYPATDMTTSYPSMRTYGSGYLMTINPDSAMVPGYLTDPQQVYDWRCSPLVADLHGVAPAAISVAEYDPIKDQGVAYADKLKASGVSAILRCAQGMTHSYAHFGWVPAAMQEWDAIISDFGALLDPEIDTTAPLTREASLPGGSR